MKSGASAKAPLGQPVFDLERARRLVADQLDPRSRVLYTLLFCVSVLFTVAIGSLLVTEHGLPLRTRLAFLALVGIGSAWTAFAAWVLSRRRPLLARHRIVSGRLALGGTAMFTLAAIGMAVANPALQDGAWTAAGLGSCLMLIARLYLRQAHRRHQELLELRSRLEAQLG